MMKDSPPKDTWFRSWLYLFRESGIAYYIGRQGPEDIHNFPIYCLLDFVSSIKFRKICLVGNWHNQKRVTGKLEKGLYLKIL